MGEGAAADLGPIFREEAGRITAALTRRFGDFDLAEEAVQDACVEALRSWPGAGRPRRPGAWLQRVAERRALDRLRRRRLELARHPLGFPRGGDDRLRLIFACCHPSLSREAQLALTLRVVAGFTTAQIARAFLVSETAVAQRITRAKRKIVAAGIPFRVPEPPELDQRLGEVLAVVYLMFNEGYLSSGWERAHDRSLAQEAAWLARLVARLMPQQPEVLGLLALCLFQLARERARFSAGGELLTLAEQDRSLWDRRAIEEGEGLLDRAAELGRPGPYQLQAAIASCHALAPSWEETDWGLMVRFYDRLAELDPSPVVRLNRAVALAHVAGPEAALRETEALTTQLDGYHLLHATRAELLRRLGREEEARVAFGRALQLTLNPAERSHLRARSGTRP